MEWKNVKIVRKIQKNNTCIFFLFNCDRLITSDRTKSVGSLIVKISYSLSVFGHFISIHKYKSVTSTLKVLIVLPF